MITKNEFINKWSNWWLFDPKKNELTIAFETELNAIIEYENKQKCPHCGSTNIEIDDYKWCKDCDTEL